MKKSVVKSKPNKQIDVEPNISVIKDLVYEEEPHVCLCEDSSGVIKGDTSKCGKPIIFVKIGTSGYHGLCDLCASISLIPKSLYLEVREDIEPIAIENTCMTIQLANKEFITPVGIRKNVEVLEGKINYHVDFIVLDCPQDEFCPIIFCRRFLHTVGAEIDLPK